MPAYPNPFYPAAAVPYELPEAARVRLAVYDMLSEERAVNDAVGGEALAVLWAPGTVSDSRPGRGG